MLLGMLVGGILFRPGKPPVGKIHTQYIMDLLYDTTALRTAKTPPTLPMSVHIDLPQTSSKTKRLLIYSSATLKSHCHFRNR